jgi:hypothetical protein
MNRTAAVVTQVWFASAAVCSRAVMRCKARTVASTAPSTKSRRWDEISDGPLFVTNQEVRTRMSLKL